MVKVGGGRAGNIKYSKSHLHQMLSRWSLNGRSLCRSDIRVNDVDHPERLGGPDRESGLGATRVLGAKGWTASSPQKYKHCSLAVCVDETFSSHRALGFLISFGTRNKQAQ